MLNEVVEPLTAWYDKNKRCLPWREQRNPYYIWISEIMLQQTRVEAVKPYFERFIKALPTVTDLAKCQEEELLKLWEGLGYYNRVRNIQKAAIIITEKYQGQLPADYQQLLALPGIGEYTAGAVASIAYGIPVPAVDGNVLRVLSRILESNEDIMKQSLRRRMRESLLAVMPPKAAGDFNQALMELGATVCVPNGAPKCELCPVQHLCQAKAHGQEQNLPVKRKAKERRMEEKTILVIRDDERVAIRKRPDRGLLAGLYELPNYPGHLNDAEIISRMKQHNLTPLRLQPLPESRHIFSHVEWRMKGYLVKVAALEQDAAQGLLFVDIRHAEERYPVPAAFQTYAAYLNLRLGQEKYSGGSV